MGIVYSATEAKAKFSEILKLVRSGQTVTVSYSGKPVAEIRPIAEKERSNDERLEDLRKRGVYIPAKSPLLAFKSNVQRPGAVNRFLEERNE